MDEFTKGLLVGGGIAIGTVAVLGILGYALYKNTVKQQQTTTTTSQQTTTTSTTQQQGYTVTIINSCYPIVTTFQPPVLVVYTDVDKTQKSIVIQYNEQATIQVYPNSVLSIYVAETYPLPAPSGGTGISPMYTGGSQLKWKLVQQITVTQDMTLQVCNENVSQTGGRGIIQPL